MRCASTKLDDDSMPDVNINTHRNCLRTLAPADLVELFESDDGSVLAEGLSAHVQAVLLDETDGAATIDTAMTVTLARGVFAFVREPDVFVSHISKRVC